MLLVRRVKGVLTRGLRERERERRERARERERRERARERERRKRTRELNPAICTVNSEIWVIVRSRGVTIPQMTSRGRD